MICAILKHLFICSFGNYAKASVAPSHWSKLADPWPILSPVLTFQVLVAFSSTKVLSKYFDILTFDWSNQKILCKILHHVQTGEIERGLRAGVLTPRLWSEISDFCLYCRLSHDFFVYS